MRRSEIRLAALRHATEPETELESIEKLKERADDLYYPRDQSDEARQWRPLPVWRARWRDGQRIYADAGSGRLILRSDSGNEWQRLLSITACTALISPPCVPGPGCRPH